MKKYVIKYSVKADSDLDEIDNYISQNLKEPNSAANVVFRIIAAIDRLETLPRRFAKVSYKGLSNEFRKMPVGNYLVYYYVDDEKSEVRIARIVYVKRSMREILNNIDEDAKD